MGGFSCSIIAPFHLHLLSILLLVRGVTALTGDVANLYRCTVQSVNFLCIPVAAWLALWYSVAAEKTFQLSSSQLCLVYIHIFFIPCTCILHQYPVTLAGDFFLFFVLSYGRFCVSLQTPALCCPRHVPVIATGRELMMC